MKYYSEILNKTFDTVDALEEAETTEKARLVEKAKAEDDKKKRLEEATKAMEEAYRNYKIAKDACSTAYKKYLEMREKYMSLLTERNEKVSGNDYINDRPLLSLNKVLDELFW